MYRPILVLLGLRLILKTYDAQSDKYTLKLVLNIYKPRKNVIKYNSKFARQVVIKFNSKFVE